MGNVNTALFSKPAKTLLFVSDAAAQERVTRWAVEDVLRDPLREPLRTVEKVKGTV